MIWCMNMSTGKIRVGAFDKQKPAAELISGGEVSVPEPDGGVA